jgi:hypothetical protein
VLNYPAATPRRIRCTDGNPACDTDGQVNGSCRFGHYARARVVGSPSELIAGPLARGCFKRHGNATLANLVDGNLGEGGETVLAFSNPLYVDVDGGTWTAPGVRLTP